MLVPIDNEDVPRIVALMNRAYRGSGASAGWSTESSYLSGDRTTEALLRAELASKPHGSLLRWDDAEGDLQGCVWLEPLDPDVWYLGSLAVNPQRQKVGLGRMLLALAEKWVYAQGGRRVRMTVVNVREALICWYLRRGYQTTGATERFPYEDDRFGTPLRDDLAFVVLEKQLSDADDGR